MTHLLWQEKKTLKYLAHPAFISCGIGKHAFLTKQSHPEGWLDFRRPQDEEDSAPSSWQWLASCFDLPVSAFLTLRQVHGDRILVLAAAASAARTGEIAPACGDPDAGPGYDGVMTDRPGIALAIRTADCVPVLLAAPIRGAIAALHVGWRGAALGLPGRAVQLFQSRFGVRPPEIMAALGPAIGGCCYQVGGEVLAALGGKEGGAAFFRPDGKNHWKLDLPALVARQLTGRGIAAVAAPPAGLCTACNPDLFFSHRGSGGEKGRQLSFIALEHK
jgi:YfiH family protein